MVRDSTETEPERERYRLRDSAKETQGNGGLLPRNLALEANSLHVKRVMSSTFVQLTRPSRVLASPRTTPAATARSTVTRKG